MEPAYRLRFACRDDNAALCALSAAAPMQAGVSVAADRGPNFFAFYDLHGDMLPGPEVARADRPAYLCVVAEHDGCVVGAVAAAIGPVRVSGRSMKLAYAMDGRVDPAHARRGVFTALWRFLEEALAAAHCDGMRGFVLRGNARAHAAAHRVLAGRTLREVLDIELVHFSMYWPYRPPRGLRVETAGPRDLDEIAALIAAHYARHNFAPSIDRAWLADLMARSPGYAPESIAVVRDGGAIVALVGLWDASSVRRLIVRRNPLRVRLGLWAARLLHLVIDSPPLPRTGEPLAALYLKHVACAPGHHPTLRALLRFVLDRVRHERRFTLVWGAFAANDPLLSLWRGFPVYRSRSVMYYAPLDSAWDLPAAELRAAPAWVDFSMV